MGPEFLWYIPNTVEPGHRGDDTVDGWGSLAYSVDLAEAAERHGWGGALIGTGWGRPDAFTVATAIAARTTTFRPLVATRPGYWQPAHFASAAATLQRLSGGRLYVNVVTGVDDLAAYGDGEFDPARRYDRTREFLQLVRRLWDEEAVTFDGEFYRVRALSTTLERRHAPLEFGLRITTVVRHSTEEAWHDAEARVARMAGQPEPLRPGHGGSGGSVGQQRLLDLAERGDVLDTCLYTAPGRHGGGGAGTTWLVGSADDVAAALRRYADLGITHFILSDTPYQQEVVRLGEVLLDRVRTAPIG